LIELIYFQIMANYITKYVSPKRSNRN